jgi:hypothetical protein
MPTTGSLFTRMDAEWQHLARSPLATHALQRWAQHHPALAGLRDLHHLRTLTYDRNDPERSDRILAALVEQAAVNGGDDPLATRTLLQLLLPGATRLVNGIAAISGDRDDAEATVAAELTIGIRCFPWQRRHRAIAANLLLDCRQRLARRRLRTRNEIAAGLQPGDAHPGAPDRSVDLDQDGTVALKQLLSWAQQHHVLNRFEASLLVSWHVYQIPVPQLVTRLGRSRSRLFEIRAAAEQRLRHALSSYGATDSSSG